MQTIDEINTVLERETGWRVELATSEFDKTDFLRLFRKSGASWKEKVFVWSLPRESPVGVLAACGGVARHYFQLGLATASEGRVESIEDLLASAEMSDQFDVPIDISPMHHAELKTTKTLKAIVEEGMARADFELMSQEEKIISVAIDELAGWLREYSPFLRTGSAIGVKIGLSAELIGAIEASLRREDAEEVLPLLSVI